MFAVNNVLAQTNVVNTDSIAKNSTKTSVVSSSVKASVKSVKTATPVATPAKATTEVATSTVKASVTQPSGEKVVTTTVTPLKRHKLHHQTQACHKWGETTIGGLIALAASSIVGLFSLGLRKKNK